MTAMYPWNALSEHLQESIEMQGVDERGDKSCGCHQRQDKWWLCSYHDGFQDAEAICTVEVDRQAGVIEQLLAIPDASVLPTAAGDYWDGWYDAVKSVQRRMNEIGGVS